MTSDMKLTTPSDGSTVLPSLPPSDGKALNGTTSVFATMGLAPVLCRALDEAGYTIPTPIQLAAIGPALEGRDVLATADTGTGKTAAFALPILHHLLQAGNKGKSRHPRALVLAPTRELAAQIAERFTAYSKYTDLITRVIFGGVPRAGQVRALERGADILVATPGRLLDLMSDGALSLRAISVVVLDEADRMFDMGFFRDIEHVFEALPKPRQALLFSATMPDPIRKFTAKVQNNPVNLSVKPRDRQKHAISESVYRVEPSRKLPLLLSYLVSEEVKRGIVFTRTKRDANRVAESLMGFGIKASAIHGNKSQGARERALSMFKSGAVHVIVATDLAARGIDVKDVSHVINFQVPEESETYVHRIGRTGRAGATGLAITLTSKAEVGYLQAIERLTRRRIDVAALPEDLETWARAQPTQPMPETRGDDIRSDRQRPHRSSQGRSEQRREGASRGRRDDGGSSFGRDSAPGASAVSKRDESAPRIGRDRSAPSFSRDAIAPRPRREESAPRFSDRDSAAPSRGERDGSSRGNRPFARDGAPSRSGGAPRFGRDSSGPSRGGSSAPRFGRDTGASAPSRSGGRDGSSSAPRFGRDSSGPSRGGSSSAPRFGRDTGASAPSRSGGRDGSSSAPRFGRDSAGPARSSGPSRSSGAPRFGRDSAGPARSSGPSRSSGAPRFGRDTGAPSRGGPGGGAPSRGGRPSEGRSSAPRRSTSGGHRPPSRSSF